MNGVIFWTAISLIVLLIIVFPPIAICIEKKDFNGGTCPICGGKLRRFDTDSQGGRGYCCDNDDYHTWVSWNTVDKKYRKDKEDKHND